MEPETIPSERFAVEEWIELDCEGETFSVGSVLEQLYYHVEYMTPATVAMIDRVAATGKITKRFEELANNHNFYRTGP